MAFSAVVFIFGAILLAIGLLGEGVSIKDISFPKVSKAARFVFVLLGTLFLVLGISFGAIEVTKDTQSPTPVAVDPKEPPPASEPTSPVLTPAEPATESTTPPTPPSEPVSAEVDTAQPPSSPAPEVSTASDEAYRAQITSQLMSMSQSAAENGFTFTDSFVDKLSNEGSYGLSLSLDEGSTYMVKAVCDEDCRDVDLLIYDENSNLVQADEEMNDFPEAVISPALSGDFTLEITMPNCAAQYCYYGVSIFEKAAEATGA
jgi:type IV secretory pathway VirB10-like protein